MWMVTPDSRSRPTDLGARLSERGLKHTGETPTMTLALSYLDARNAQVADLEIEQVRDLATFRTWMDVFGVSYGVPPSEGRTLFDLWTQSDKSFTDPSLRFYLGRLDGEPVATSALTLGARCAGIWTVSTLAKARRRGVGSALTVAPLLIAREAGY